MNTSWSDLELDIIHATADRLFKNYSDYESTDPLSVLAISKALATTVKEFTLKDEEGNAVDLTKEFAHPSEYLINTIKEVWTSLIKNSPFPAN